MTRLLTGRKGDKKNPDDSIVVVESNLTLHHFSSSALAQESAEDAPPEPEGGFGFKQQNPRPQKFVATFKILFYKLQDASANVKYFIRTPHLLRGLQ